jgi:hypothetical protein
VRHRIFGPLRPACPAHNVLDLRYLAQDILDPVIQSIDFVERRFCGKNGLQKEGAFVQLRHEITADAEADSNDRDGNQDRRGSHERRMSKASIE